MLQFVFMMLSLLTAVFLILLVLVQRGRGGGLTGALGGMGGQSAFGSKAGDLFTRITIGVAAFWIILSVAAIKVLNTPDTVFGDTEQTEFQGSSTPTMTTDPETVLPDATPATSAMEPATSSEPVTTEEAVAPSPEAPATTEPAAPSPTEPAGTESTPEKAAAPGESE